MEIWEPDDLQTSRGWKQRAMQQVLAAVEIDPSFKEFYQIEIIGGDPFQTQIYTTVVMTSAGEPKNRSNQVSSLRLTLP